MSKKQWLILFFFFVCYLFMGASVFYFIEHPLEQERRLVERLERNQIHFMLIDKCQSSTEEFNMLVDSLTDYCGKPVTYIEVKHNDTASVDDDEPYHWSYYNAFFFSLITISTVGYGNLTPSSDHGKLLVIFYSLFGVPYLSIVIAQLGEFFGSVFLRAHDKYKNHSSKCGLVMVIMKYLVPGIIVFIIAPAGVISHMEDWSYIVSLYYSYVTLTTIGYGDIVAGQLDDRSGWYKAYKIILIIWIMFGLGYLAMIIGYLVKALKSKKINKMEKKIANKLKKTQSKIWNEFMQEVSYVRRVLNELYLMKVKPVYREGPRELRSTFSQSCPNLSEWPVLRKKASLQEEKEDEEKMIAMRRSRRAYSEAMGLPRPLQRVHSDGHLNRIDRKATFSNRHIPYLEPGLILARMADAFESQSTSSSRSSSPEPGERKVSSIHGINIFSDEEILASEKANYGSKDSWGSNGWIIGGNDSPPPQRSRRHRAFSEATHPYNFNGPNGLLPPEQKTWTSNDTSSLHQWAMLKNMNMNGELPPKVDSENVSIPPTPSGLRRVSIAAMNFLSSNTQKFVKNVTNSMTKVNAEEKESSLEELDPERILKELNADGKRPSIVAALMSSSPHGSNNNISPILEQTSIADFIRVMSSLKKLETGLSRDERRPRRKSTLGIQDERRFSLGGRVHRMSMRKDSKSETAPIQNPSFLAYSSMNGKPRRSSSGVSPVEMMQRRRRFSYVPNISSSTLNSDEGVGHVVGMRRRAVSVFNQPPPYIRGKPNPSTPSQPPTLVVTSPEGGHRTIPTTQRQPSLVQEEQTDEDDDLHEIISVRL